MNTKMPHSKAGCGIFDSTPGNKEQWAFGPMVNIYNHNVIVL